MNLDVDQLLTIDVDSEIRKLAEAELGGTWQIPAELVRRSLRARAGRVDVELKRPSIRIADDGAPLDDDTVRALLVLLSPAQAPAARHRALLELEALGEVGLIALAGLKSQGLRIVCEGIERVRLGTPRAGDLPRHGTVIELDGVELDFAQAKAWLEVALKFAPAAVRLDGEELDRGSEDAIVEAELQPPLDGVVALLRKVEGARVWMLKWGVVATHTTLPGGLAVEAAIELGDRAKGQVGAGELRAAFKRELEQVEAQAIALAIHTAGQMAQLPAADRVQVRMLLLGSAKLAQLPEVRKVKMLPALYGPTQALEWTSVEQLIHHATGKSALAVDSEAKAANAVTHQPIFVLSAAERTRLGQLYAVTFAPPPSAVTGGPRLSLKGLAEGSARAARAAAGLVAGTWQRPVPDDRLSDAERAALTIFRQAAASSGKRTAFSEVELCEGDGAAVLRKKKLVLPRRNRDVLNAIALVSRDQAWAYPALVALLGGVAMPPTGARDAWAGR